MTFKINNECDRIENPRLSILIIELCYNREDDFQMIEVTLWMKNKRQSESWK